MALADGSTLSAHRDALSLATAALALLTLAGAAPKQVSDDDVIAAVNRIVTAGTKDGVFSLRDAKTGNTLALEFDSVRVVRGLAGFGWFPDVIFREKGAPQKKYAVDFWLKPDGDELKLVDARVHKDPQPDGQAWMMITRAPLLWWWLPTLERKSATSGIEAWQVMGATHAYIAAHEKRRRVSVRRRGWEIGPARARANLPDGRARQVRRQVLYVRRISQLKRLNCFL